jgi:hypothetical protein
MRPPAKKNPSRSIYPPQAPAYQCAGMCTGKDLWHTNPAFGMLSISRARVQPAGGYFHIGFRSMKYVASICFRARCIHLYIQIALEGNKRKVRKIFGKPGTEPSVEPLSPHKYGPRVPVSVPVTGAGTVPGSVCVPVQDHYGHFRLHKTNVSVFSKFAP